MNKRVAILLRMVLSSLLMVGGPIFLNVGLAQEAATSPSNQEGSPQSDLSVKSITKSGPSGDTVLGTTSLPAPAPTSTEFLQEGPFFPGEGSGQTPGEENPPDEYEPGDQPPSEGQKIDIRYRFDSLKDYDEGYLVTTSQVVNGKERKLSDALLTYNGVGRRDKLESYEEGVSYLRGIDVKLPNGTVQGTEWQKWYRRREYGENGNIIKVTGQLTHEEKAYKEGNYRFSNRKEYLCPGGTTEKLELKSTSHLLQIKYLDEEKTTIVIDESWDEFPKEEGKITRLGYEFHVYSTPFKFPDNPEGLREGANIESYRVEWEVPRSVDDWTKKEDFHSWTSENGSQGTLKETQKRVFDAKGISRQEIETTERWVYGSRLDPQSRIEETRHEQKEVNLRSGRIETRSQSHSAQFDQSGKTTSVMAKDVEILENRQTDYYHEGSLTTWIYPEEGRIKQVKLGREDRNSNYVYSEYELWFVDGEEIELTRGVFESSDGTKRELGQEELLRVYDNITDLYATGVMNLSLTTKKNIDKSINYYWKKKKARVRK